MSFQSRTPRNHRPPLVETLSKDLVYTDQARVLTPSIATQILTQDRMLRVSQQYMYRKGMYFNNCLLHINWIFV